MLNVWSTFDADSNIDVDATAEQLTTTFRAANVGVLVQADDDNSGDVWVGNDNSVAVDNGFRLSAGDALFLEVSSPDLIFVIGSVANQKVNFVTI